MSTVWTAGALSLAWAVTLPPSAAGQTGCEFGDRGNDLAVTENIPGVGRVTYITRPHFVCQDGVQILADSAVAYEERGMSHLMGSVRFTEPGRELQADVARYFSNEGRMQAEGHVSVIDEAQGSSIENGDLVYLLQTDFRAEESMTVTTGADGLRPRAVLTPPPDTTEADTGPREPYTVVGDRIFLRGAGYFTSAGAAEIVRDSLFAYADSAEYDEERGTLALVGAARVEGDTYVLTGRTIEMMTPGGPESEIRALREARLTGDDLILTSARILLLLRDDTLERLVATRLASPLDADADSVDLERPEAFVDEFVLTADSLEVSAPGDRIERVFAAGSARSVSSARDSLNHEVLPDVARRDWLEGDTVIIRFAVADSTQKATPPEPTGRATATDDSGSEVEEIIARVSARSLYRLPPSDTTSRAGTDPPAVHYVVGREIRIRMNAGEVEGMSVSGQTRGVHLEPLGRAPPDSGAVVPDTGAVVPDTGAVVPDTGTVIDTTATSPVGQGPAGAGSSVPPMANDLSAPTTSDPLPTTTNDSTPADGPKRRPEDNPWIRP